MAQHRSIQAVLTPDLSGPDVGVPDSVRVVVVVLYKQIWTAFLANPFLNALFTSRSPSAIVFAYRQVMRLFRSELGQRFRLADPGLFASSARAAGAHGGPAARSIGRMASPRR